MYVFRSDSSKTGFRPCNNLTSARTPHFSSQSLAKTPFIFGGLQQHSRVPAKRSEEDINHPIPQSRELLPPTFVFGGDSDQALSELGNSSPLFSFRPPEEDIDHSIPQNRQSSSPIFVFGGQSGRALSELGKSSPLFSFRSPDSTRVYSVGTSPQYQVGGSSLRTVSSPHQSSNIQSSCVSDCLQPSPPETSGLGKHTMVMEREPPKLPLSPTKLNKQSSQKHGQPEFGMASTLQSPLRPSLFNIPKQNQARPEHHRTNTPIVAAKNFQTTTNEHVTIQPFQARAVRNLEVVRGPTVSPDFISRRPANAPVWSDYPTHPPTYSSAIGSLGTFTSVNVPSTGLLGNYVDLTDNALFESKFGHTEPYDHIDIGKATENIKALLEGVFEDDEDKPRTRGRKKKLHEQAIKLAAKLEGLNVGEGSKSDEAVYGEEDEEEDADDGTVDGLKVKLLPHQVDGVEWMKEKEVGVRKKNGVLPKGGILADDVGSLILPLSTTDHVIDGSWKNYTVYCTHTYQRQTANKLY